MIVTLLVIGELEHTLIGKRTNNYKKITRPYNIDVIFVIYKENEHRTKKKRSEMMQGMGR